MLAYQRKEEMAIWAERSHYTGGQTSTPAEPSLACQAAELDLAIQIVTIRETREIVVPPC